MKNYSDIHTKIDTLMDCLNTAIHNESGAAVIDQICAQIDGLLWVIGDTSGAPLMDELIKEKRV